MPREQFLMSDCLSIWLRQLFVSFRALHVYRKERRKDRISIHLLNQNLSFYPWIYLQHSMYIHGKQTKHAEDRTTPV